MRHRPTRNVRLLGWLSFVSMVQPWSSSLSSNLPSSSFVHALSMGHVNKMKKTNRRHSQFRSSSNLNGGDDDNDQGFSNTPITESSAPAPSTTMTTAFQNRRAFLNQVASTTAGVIASSSISATTPWSANAAAAAAGTPVAVGQAVSSSSSLPSPRLAREYFENLPHTRPMAGRFYFPTLTPPFFNRATYRYDLGRNTWALEQLLTFANVTATIRTTVIQLQSQPSQDNSSSSSPSSLSPLLWVHSPQWPTGELCQLLDELGTVQHVVLPCNALEHKAPMAAFLQHYPKASVWIAPGQYGPFGSCGLTLLLNDDNDNNDNNDNSKPCNMGYRVDGILYDPPTLSASSLPQQQQPQRHSPQQQPPWMDEFDYTTLYVNLPENAGPVSEVAFVHRPTKTLIVTDAVVFIPDEAPSILETYFDAKVVQNDVTFWPKTVLQSVFLPLRFVNNNNDDDTATTIMEEGGGGGGFYPGYEAIKNRLIRAPILRGFNDARAPQQVKEWIQRVTATKGWAYDRVISSHFASPIVASPQEVQQVFQYLNVNNNNGDDNDNGSTRDTTTSALPPIACQDWELLQGLNDFIATNKLGAPATFDYRQGCIDP